jgi:predicted GIY-YIG superfamily endonuclease
MQKISYNKERLNNKQLKSRSNLVKKYKLSVFYELQETMEEAMKKEGYIKSDSRAKNWNCLTNKSCSAEFYKDII